MDKTTRLSRTAALLLGLIMAGAATANLTLPFEDSVLEPGEAFRIDNTYTGSTRSYGGYFSTAGAQGRAVYARVRSIVADVNSYGGFFYADSPKGRGVFGQSTGAQEGIGVKGWASSDEDVQNYGGHFTSAGLQGIGVYGWAENPNADALNYGGVFQADGGRGIGIYAVGGPKGSAAVFEGDVVIVGKGHGIVFSDGSKQTSATGGGSPGGFPRPAYDSGWVTLPWNGSRGGTVELTHNLGGDPENYFVDLQFYYQSVESDKGIHNEGHGGDRATQDYESRGAYYHALNATSVKVTSSDRTTYFTPKARVRIWVYE